MYLFYKYINDDHDIKKLENYFVKQRKNNFEEDSKVTEALTRSYKNIKEKLYQYGNNKESFINIIEYIINTLKNNYPELFDLDTKVKERILYKTVDKSQRGERVFKNFRTVFDKNITDI